MHFIDHPLPCDFEIVIVKGDWSWNTLFPGWTLERGEIFVEEKKEGNLCWRRKRGKSLLKKKKREIFVEEEDCGPCLTSGSPRGPTLTWGGERVPFWKQWWKSGNYFPMWKCEIAYVKVYKCGSISLRKSEYLKVQGNDPNTRVLTAQGIKWKKF